MNFSYHCPTRIEFGMGKSQGLAGLLEEMQLGPRIFAVADPGVVSAGLLDPLIFQLTHAGYSVEMFAQVMQNPRDTDCVAGAEQFREAGCDALLAVGGGSAMDTAKAIALLAKSGGVPTEYVDEGRAYKEMASVVCLPTTAGTGSEVTRSAVITEAQTHRKMTLKHAHLRPKLAILDPLLTLSVPPQVTAATGIDALVHAIEGTTCTVTQPISQAFGVRAMAQIVRALPRAYAQGQDLDARSQMMEGSLLAGLCFGSADVAAVHCLAEALGSLYDTPHGVANAVFLPHVLRFNAKGAMDLHAQVARWLGLAGEEDGAEQAVALLLAGVSSLIHNLGIPALRNLPGVREEDFPRLVELAFANNSTPSNVRPITRKDYEDILWEAFSQHSS